MTDRDGGTWFEEDREIRAAIFRNRVAAAIIGVALGFISGSVFAVINGCGAI